MIKDINEYLSIKAFFTLALKIAHSGVNRALYSNR